MSSYTLALISSIPVYRSDDGKYIALDLWVRDLEVQINCVAKLFLICPVISEAAPSGVSFLDVCFGVEIIDFNESNLDRVLECVKAVDVLQIPGVANWRDSKLSRLALSVRKRLGLKTIVGISSNRAKTAFLNKAGLKKYTLGVYHYLSIRFAQVYLTTIADGCFIVGDGLLPLVSKKCPSVHVGYASWISKKDIEKQRVSPVRVVNESWGFSICIAARLERMKGVDLGIMALSELRRRQNRAEVRLRILGSGAELDNLQELVEELDMSACVDFDGTFGYPEPFLSELSKSHIFVISNLNDEQPRVLFDAICAGCLPIYPSSAAFAKLGMPLDLMYQVGDVNSLVEVMNNTLSLTEFDAQQLKLQLLEAAMPFTIDSMHDKRRLWIEREILGSTCVQEI